jgi:hypothetical protein
MSRGLGKMQRLIMDALTRRPFDDWVNAYCLRIGDFKLMPGYHDLRKVAQEIARDNGAFSHCSFIDPAWQASFSRAIRGLAERGFIEVPSMILLANDRTGRAIHCSDGLWMFQPRQRRFVRISAKDITLDT